jgi:hypothetical protein
MKKRAKTMGEWPPIIIFPEGTCTNRSCLIGFKQGKDVGKFLSKCTRPIVLALFFISFIKFFLELGSSRFTYKGWVYSMRAEKKHI